MSVNNRESGIATLPTILILSAIIIVVAVAAVGIAASLATTANSQRIASQALSDAKAGSDDAFMRVIRYKNCPATIGCPSAYTLTIGPNDVANVTIKGSAAVGVITITSEGVSLGRRVKLQTIVGVDSTTGLVNLESSKQIPD
jgi:hypothetical protein